MVVSGGTSSGEAAAAASSQMSDADALLLELDVLCEAEETIVAAAVGTTESEHGNEVLPELRHLGSSLLQLMEDDIESRKSPNDNDRLDQLDNKLQLSMLLPPPNIKSLSSRSIGDRLSERLSFVNDMTPRTELFSSNRSSFCEMDKENGGIGLLGSPTDGSKQVVYTEHVIRSPFTPLTAISIDDDDDELLRDCAKRNSGIFFSMQNAKQSVSNVSESLSQSFSVAKISMKEATDKAKLNMKEASDKANKQAQMVSQSMLDAKHAMAIRAASIVDKLDMKDDTGNTAKGKGGLADDCDDIVYKYKTAEVPHNTDASDNKNNKENANENANSQPPPGRPGTRAQSRSLWHALGRKAGGSSGSSGKSGSNSDSNSTSSRSASAVVTMTNKWASASASASFLAERVSDRVWGDSEKANSGECGFGSLDSFGEITHSGDETTLNLSLFDDFVTDEVAVDLDCLDDPDML